MKNKKLWILAVCILFLLLLVVFVLNRKDLGETSPAEVQQSAAGVTAEESSGKTDVKSPSEGTAAETGNGEDTISIADENSGAEEDDDSMAVIGGNGENLSSEENAGSGTAENTGLDQTTEEQTEEGVVIIIPEGTDIGEGND